MNPRSLPIHELEGDLLRAFRAHTRLVIEAPTGSGKSTQVPQILLDGGAIPEGQIVVLQPRRLAARMLAARVAAERNGAPGDEVGYQVRFNSCASRSTRILYITEGILLRRLLSDPGLRNVNTLILDEFHERHLEGDVALGYALTLQRTLRPDLRIIVMSATLDGDLLDRHMNPCARLRSSGRTFPVRVEYLAQPADENKTPAWDLAARELDRVLRACTAGHVLIFMPGVYEITRTLQAARALPATQGMDVMPLHGELGEREQDLAVAPGARRKIIVATNVAETSLTIPDVRAVIDSGLARVLRFDPHRGINTLLTEKISRDSADQRAGRAGRTADGLCLRLWTEAQHKERTAQTAPEIRRLDLSETVLTLKTAGTQAGLPAPTEADPLADIRAFPWLDAPEERPLRRAFQLLADLDAVSSRDGAVTAVGRSLVQFPLHPRFGRMLLAASRLGCLETAALVAAITQERSLLVRRANEVVRGNRDLHLDAETSSDFFPLLEAWRFARKHQFDPEECRRLGIHAITARRVEQAWNAMLRIAGEQGLRVAGDEAPEALRQCVLLGFSDQLGRRVSAGSLRYELVHGRRGTLSRDSSVRSAELLVASEIREIEAGRNEVDVLLSLCTAVDPAWIEACFGAEISQQRAVAFDPASKRVVARTQQVFRTLVLSARNTSPTDEEAAPLLAAEVLAGRATLKRWNHEADQWVARVNLVARMFKEKQIPLIDEAARLLIVTDICMGHFSLKDVKDLPVLPALKQWLSPAQRAEVEKHAPERVTLSNGKTPRVVYGNDAPSIHVRIQELFGVTGGVRLPGGRVSVVIHILAPNQRPVQITEDLAGFWKDTYLRVKRELQRKYPKHEWR
jgi:ATP-dependent helicase HrpB